MTQNEKPGKLKNLNYYLIKTLKFYDLKNESLSRLVFIIILIANFIGIFVPENVYLDIILNLARMTVVHLASAVYLTAYIKDLKGEACGIHECFGITVKNALKILVASISYIITIIATFGMYLSFEIMAVVIFILGIPLLVIYLMFIFNVCYVVDQGKGVAESYRASRKITFGYKKAIFFTILIFNFILAIPLSFLMIISMITSNDLVYAFVFSFATTVVNIMQNRLITLLYMDLEYGNKEAAGQYGDKDYYWPYGNKEGNWQYGNRGREVDGNKDNNEQNDSEDSDR
ncbi:MAG TPA: hypothetical protein GXX36_01575 [Clostridiaceae bacterium]|nr:hypothetical protein [Clostridiaceae bacterium]